MLNKYKRLLVTGGAGFIGSAFIRLGLKTCGNLQKLVNLDLLTYAADLSSLKEVQEDNRYVFVKGDIRDKALVSSLIDEHQIDAIVHFAAETHVDNSILDPYLFYETNVAGTIALLEVLRQKTGLHFHHISTDEVYGSLKEEGYFTEDSLYLPNSPYAASKASSDHFVRAYSQTFGLSVTVSHCTNNFGPFQHKEKFIPVVIQKGLKRQPIPIYGSGNNYRDWIYVEDHAEAIYAILEKGRKNEVYDVGGDAEKKNLDLAYLILEELALLQKESVEDLKKLITFVKDRPGHDFRYCIDGSKVKNELGWRPKHDFLNALRKTIKWYADQQDHSLLES